MIENTKALLWQAFFAIAMFLSTFISYLLPIVIFTRRNRNLFQSNSLNRDEEDIQRPHHWSNLSNENLSIELKKIRLKRILSYCNCVSAGVFLGVCFLNLIPYVEDEFANLIKDFDSLKQFVGTFPLGQFSVVLGLFLVLILESLLTKCFKTPSHSTNDAEHANTTVVPILYLDEEVNENRDPLNEEDHSEQQELLLPDETIKRNGHKNIKDDRSFSINAKPSVSVNNESSNYENTAFEYQGHHHHGPEFLADNQESMLSFFILMFATSIHSLFEGLALGLQSDLKNAIHLFIGIIIHECLVAVALGLNAVRRQQRNLRMMTHIKFALVFSLTIPIGNILGVLLGYTPGHFGRFISAIFQGFAAGTFIHVTFLELIPEELLSNDCDNKEDELNKLFQDNNKVEPDGTNEIVSAQSSDQTEIPESCQSNQAYSNQSNQTTNYHSNHHDNHNNHHHNHSPIKLRKILLLFVGFLLMAVVPLIFPE